MAEPINIGIDFGSMGCRAACLADERVIPILLNNSWNTTSRWLICERSPASILGVHFPSLKSRLGMESAASGEEIQSATTMVRQLLTELHHLAEKNIGRPPGQLVIAVPALYSSARRSTLRELALAAGFSDVHLINDSMAAVIGHTYQREASLTTLVYGMGYSGFEVGLIRVAKGRYRALGYDGAPSPGGAAFDASLVRSLFLELIIHQFWSPKQGLAPAAWLQLRDRFQRLKEQLSTEEVAGLRLFIGMPPALHELSLFLFRAPFEQAVAEAMGSSLNTAERLLEDANLSVADIDEVLLVGGSTRIGVVRRLLAERFTRQPVGTPENLIAQGAAIYAARLGQMPTTEAIVVHKEEAEAAEELTPTMPVMKVTLSSEDSKGPADDGAKQSPDAFDSELLPKPDTMLALDLITTEPVSAATTTSVENLPENAVASMESMQGDREYLFRHARQLIKQGAYDRAHGFLQGLIQDAQALLADIPDRSGMRPEVKQALRRGYALLNTSGFDQAVEQAHLAYALDPENPEVFQQMIDIHCRAAMANPTIEGYKKSIQWLICAYNHDRTNVEIHNRIAERHFIHAQQLAEQGNHAEALKVLEECLYFNPEHEGANTLRATLSGS